MSAFDLLLIAHLTGDFLFQTEWMAVQKQKRLLPLFVHCTVYTAIIFLFSAFLLDQSLSIWGIALIYIGHFILDQGGFIRFWYRKITMSNDPGTWWLKVVYDQIFHLILIYIAIQL